MGEPNYIRLEVHPPVAICAPKPMSRRSPIAPRSLVFPKAWSSVRCTRTAAWMLSQAVQKGERRVERARVSRTHHRYGSGPPPRLFRSRRQPVNPRGTVKAEQPLTRSQTTISFAGYICDRRFRPVGLSPFVVSCRHPA